MEIMKKLGRQAGEPSGRLGRLLGRCMNMGHGGLRRWALGEINIVPGSCILDVGCGGGKTVQVMAEADSGCKVYGIDPSEEMVRLSGDVNRELIEAGRVEIIKSRVSSLPFPDGEFDMVTAFETFHFWPDPVGDLREVKRVLKPGGKVLLANEVYEDERFEKRNARYARMIEGLELHPPEQYREFLARAGFTGVETRLVPEKNRILALATKE